jgi:hypothetical protein
MTLHINAHVLAGQRSNDCLVHKLRSENGREHVHLCDIRDLGVDEQSEDVWVPGCPQQEKPA